MRNNAVLGVHRLLSMLSHVTVIGACDLALNHGAFPCVVPMTFLQTLSRSVSMTSLTEIAVFKFWSLIPTIP